MEVEKAVGKGITDNVQDQRKRDKGQGEGARTIYMGNGKRRNGKVSVRWKSLENRQGNGKVIRQNGKGEQWSGVNHIIDFFLAKV